MVCDVVSVAIFTPTHLLPHSRTHTFALALTHTQVWVTARTTPGTVGNGGLEAASATPIIRLTNYEVLGSSAAHSALNPHLPSAHC